MLVLVMLRACSFRMNTGRLAMYVCMHQRIQRKNSDKGHMQRTVAMALKYLHVPARTISCTQRMSVDVVCIGL